METDALYSDILNQGNAFALFELAKKHLLAPAHNRGEILDLVETHVRNLSVGEDVGATVAECKRYIKLLKMVRTQALGQTDTTSHENLERTQLCREFVEAVPELVEFQVWAQAKLRDPNDNSDIHAFIEEAVLNAKRVAKMKKPVHVIASAQLLREEATGSGRRREQRSKQCFYDEKPGGCRRPNCRFEHAGDAKRGRFGDRKQRPKCDNCSAEFGAEYGAHDPAKCPIKASRNKTSSGNMKM